MWPFVLGTEVSSYIVINSLVFSLGVVWVYRRSLKFKHNATAALDIALVGMVGGFLGARIVHILFEYPDIYLRDPSLIFKFWQGGFVFYGGLVGGFLAAWLLCRWRKLDFLKHGDLFAPVLATGYGLGRLSCLAAGCCYGKPTSLPWAISFPIGVQAPAGVTLHPTQIYSFLWEMGVVIVLLFMEKKRSLKRPGQLLGLWFLLHGLGRVVMEQFRGDFRGMSFINLSLSTWLSFVAMGLGLWLLKGKKNYVSAAA